LHFWFFCKVDFKKLKIGVSVLICNGLDGNVWVDFQQWVGIGDLIYPLAPEYSGSSFPFGCGLYFGMPASTTKGGFQGDSKTDSFNVK